MGTVKKKGKSFDSSTLQFGDFPLAFHVKVIRTLNLSMTRTANFKSPASGGGRSPGSAGEIESEFVNPARNAMVEETSAPTFDIEGGETRPSTGLAFDAKGLSADGALDANDNKRLVD